MFLSFFIILALFSFSAFVRAAEDDDVGTPEYYLDVSFNIAESVIGGTSRIVLKKGREVWITAGDLKIISIMINDRIVPSDFHGPLMNLTPEEDGIMEIKYEGVFNPSLPADHDSLSSVQSVIDERGISLTGIWYPRTEGLSRYRLKVVLPRGYEAVSEADEIKKVTTDNGTEFYFYFDHPADSINLIASDKYIIAEDRFEDIEIRAYMFKEDMKFADTYLMYTKKYLDIYKGLIGKYPYKRFQ